MANLFDLKEPTRADKMRASRKITTQLTKDAIEYINGTGQMHCVRSNNIPSYRTQKVIKHIDGYDKDGKPCQYPYETVEIHHKAKNIKEAILDIQGFTLPYGDYPGGVHVEIEIKTGNDTLSDEQKTRIEKLQSAGAICFVVSDMETLKIHLAKYLKPKLLPF